MATIRLEGVLLEKLKAGEVSAEGLRIVLEAGIREPKSEAKRS